MPSWKKVLVSGSNAHLNHVTSSGNFSASLNSTGSFGDIIVGATENSQFYSDFSSSIQSRVAASEAGGVTGVTAGTGISGGGSSGTVTVNVDFSDSTFNTNVSGSWRGELSSSVMTDVGGGVTGSSTSTGSFGHVLVDGTTLSETIADTVGAMVGSNTETGISVTYQDGDNTLDFALDAAQTTITSLLATDIKIGEDDQTKIDFGTTNEINFAANNQFQMKLTDGVFQPVSDSDVDLGQTGARWKDAYIDTVTTTGNVSGSLASTGSFGRVELTTIGAFKAEGAIDFNNENMTNVDIDSGTITGITDLAVADGGTGASTFTDGGILLGSGTDAITAMSVLGDGEMIVGDGSTDPVAESGATLRTSIGVGTTDTPTFAGLNTTGDIVIQGSLTANSYIVSSSVTHLTSSFSSGSTIFGDDTTDNHEFTGSVNISGSVTVGDNTILGIGDANDLQLIHDGSNSFIKDAGTGTIFYRSGTQTFQNAAASKTMMVLNAANSVDLNYNDSTKFKTTNTGITVTGGIVATGDVSSSLASTGSFGNLEVKDKAYFPDGGVLNFGDGNDLQIYHGGSNSIIQDAGTGGLILRATELKLIGNNTSDEFIVATENAGVEIYYDDVKKFETTNTGVVISGSLYVSGSTGGNLGAISASGDIVADGDIIAYNASDRELKDNLQVIQGSLDKIGEINGYEFDWNDKSPGWARERGHDVGVVAQEVQKILPEVVTKRKNGYLGVDYKRIVPLLIESIKELKQEIEILKKKVN